MGLRVTRVSYSGARYRLPYRKHSDALPRPNHMILCRGKVERFITSDMGLVQIQPTFPMCLYVLCG
jgi:hypothetical protein